MLFSLKKDSRTRRHKVKLVKDQCRLVLMKYSFSQRTINKWDNLFTCCFTASSVITFKTRLTHIIGGGRVNKNWWTLDKPMAALFTYYLGLWLGWQILLNLVKRRLLVRTKRSLPLQR